MNKSTVAATICLICATLLCGGCSLFDGFANWGKRSSAPQNSTETPSATPYGVETAVRQTLDVVKTAGHKRVIGSRAIRLPSHPLNEITAFEYEFPGTCGGHQFRVYETDETQILEYRYTPAGGSRYVIRDYITGPNPFIQAGLWSAYDHTADGVGDMTLQFEKRGSGILTGTYSQGPVTGLDASEKRTLGRAYDRALRDTYACRS